MNIVIIGTGNVAAILGRKFRQAGHTILQVIGRNASAASKLAYEWDTESANYTSLVNKHADVYLIAVSDNAIDDITSDLVLPGKIVAHTAASVSKDVLSNVSGHYGVFYPLQSLRKEAPVLPETPIFIDGSDEQTIKTLERLAESIRPATPIKADDETRLKLHVAAVFVNNFTNHLYSLAADYCRKEGIDFRQLLPLIEETALRMRTIAPKDAQTGPAVRHDKETLNKHLDLLKAHPHLKNIYLLLTESIQQHE